MKKIFNNISRALKVTLFTLPLWVTGSLLTSCDDFLSIQPTNEIVLENYWTEEADVYSVLNSCYAQLESSDCITRMAIWGEARSDNMTNGSGTNTNLSNIFKENILETNDYAKWQCFYQVINYCNTVIHYAPGVNEIDPNFTDSELRATIAEATALRALCYFYLIRTFRDVPYVTEPSIDDAQDYVVAATPFDEVLDSLIADVESISEDAVRSYGEKSVENKCRITRWSCYALLADLYLWKGEWQKCIDNCDKVIDHKIAEYKEDYEENPTTITTELYGKYPLISESTANSNYAGNTYTEIFGEGNSFESIFELNFVKNQSVSNPLVASQSPLYGSSSTTTGQIGVPTVLFEEASTGKNDYFKKTDCRYLENMTSENNKVYITKYVNESCSFRTTNTSGAPTVNADARNNAFANWIIYRLTDVMLMRAEAEVELAGDVAEGSTLTEEQTAHYRSAFACVSAIWKRANNKRIATNDTLVYDDYAISRTTMEDLILGERQRELMFEGKRWYDLVRMCRRESKDDHNERMISKVINKFQENTSAIRIKLQTEDILYWPYHRDEIKQNTLLIQNPAYETDNIEHNF